MSERFSPSEAVAVAVPSHGRAATDCGVWPRDRYVVVQFVRFFFKERAQEQCKILKDVKFPEELDLIEFVTPELQKKIKPMRDAFEEHRNAEIEAEVTADAPKPEDAAAAAAPPEFEPYSFPDDPGSNNSGRYELAAVLTHKGRSTNSGHYVGWGKLEGDDNWAIFDDDSVTAVKSKDIMQLSGELGGESPLWPSCAPLAFKTQDSRPSFPCHVPCG